MLIPKPRIVKFNICVRILLPGILMLCFLVSCGNKNQEYVDMPFDKEASPTMQDDSVTVLISDSGIIRYKMITEVWFSYDRASDPYWYFPQKIYIEQFDTAFHKQATLKADTAWNFHQRKLWRLKGNVFMKNIKEETFSTDELFWDEKLQKIYSDRYIEIYKPNELTLKGYGFESNMDMTQYKIFSPFDSPFVVDDEQDRNRPREVVKPQNQDTIK